MRKLPVVAAILLAATGCQQMREADIGNPAPTELAVEDILSRHVAARGGPAAFEAYRSVSIVVDVVEPEFTVAGVYRAHRDGEMRVDIYADEARVFSEGIDSVGAWQQGGEGAEIKDVANEGRDKLAQGIDYRFYGLKDPEKRGHRVELAGREEVDGVLYYVLRVDRSDGHRRFYYINPANWLVERSRETTALHPDIDPEKRPEETIYFDFADVCGLVTARQTRKVDLLTGKEIQRTSSRSIECNPARADLRLTRAPGDAMAPPG